MKRFVRISLWAHGAFTLALGLLAACDKKSGGASPTIAKPEPGKPAAPAAPPAQAPSRGPERVAFSLVDNRVAAHRSCGGTAIFDAGGPGFVKYTRLGNTVRGKKGAWDMMQREGEVPVARLREKVGAVYVPLDDAQAQAAAIWLRVFAPEAQALSVKVNGRDVNLQLAAGWSTVNVPAPAGALRPGENELIWLFGQAGAAVAWFAVGATQPADVLAPSFSDQALAIADTCALAWYAMIPADGRVTADLADGACALTVRVQGEGGETLTGELRGKGSALEVGKLAGQAARVELAATGCATAKVANAALVVPGEAAAAVPKAEPPKYVVLWVMDSLRADRVRPFNPKARAEAPTFEKLAESSALFRNTFVQGNESRVSHASLWTSLYPIKHKSIDEKEILDLAWVSVEEVAKAAGLATFGVSGNGYIRPKRGFGNAWDQYVNHIEKSLGLKGADILKAGLDWVQAKKEPWFLYLGTIDTHVTWRAKAPWADKYDPGYTGRFADSFSGEDAAQAATGKLTLTDKEKQHVRALYDANVSYQDDLLKQLIDSLTAAGLWEQTMLIVTADHGDEQWEDGRVGHGASVRDMLVNVPLLIHYPPLLKPGIYEQGAESVDVVPTLAEALGVKPDAEWQGASLIGLTHGLAADYPRLVVASQYEGVHGGRLAHWKIRLAGTGTPRLYNLAKDTEEQADLWGKPEASIGARLMLDSMWQYRYWNSKWQKPVWGTAANVTPAFATAVSEAP